MAARQFALTNRTAFRMDKQSAILILGGSGLIGSACIRVFNRLGFEKILSPSRQELDLTDGNSVNLYFANNTIDIVILAAGKVGGILENKNNPVDFLNINLAVHTNVCKAAFQENCSKIVVFGSSCMYPKACKQPMQVDDLFTGKMEPTSIAYAISKVASFQLAFAYNQQFQENRFLCIIPNSAYGPNDNFNPETGHVLSALIHRFHEAKLRQKKQVTLWGSGLPRREFIFSEDIAEAVLFLIQNNVSTFEKPLNIGCGIDHSIKDLADVICSEVGFRGDTIWDDTKPDGTPRKLLDSSHINFLGWQPKVDLKTGIKNTYNWYLENR